jgi:Transcription factor/nuclear export subunit protein 2
MFIIRGGLKPIFLLTEDEFNQKVHMFKSILDMHLDQRLAAVTDDKFEMNEYFNERLFVRSRKEEVWQVLNPKLYTIFWYLNLQNLIVPEDTYTDQIKKLQKQLDELKPSTN